MLRIFFFFCPKIELPNLCPSYSPIGTNFIYSGQFKVFILKQHPNILQVESIKTKEGTENTHDKDLNFHSYKSVLISTKTSSHNETPTRFANALKLRKIQ